MNVLTDKQRHILSAIADGMLVKEYAAQSGVSITNTSRKLQRAREALGAKTIAHAIAIAITTKEI